MEKSHLYCPRCKGFNVWELDGNIYCPNCSLTFKGNAIQQFLDDNILSIEELNGILDTFHDEEEDLKNPFD